MTIKINTAGVAGAGTMGAGIAQVFAQNGIRTILYDLNSSVLDSAKESIESGFEFLMKKGKISEKDAKAFGSNITYTNQVNNLKADFIVEAIVEKLHIKHELFLKLAEINEPSTILATNTSSIPITQIAAPIPFPERVVGVHFFNPAPVMKLVEIIKGAQTSEHACNLSFNFISGLGKTCVMASDAPGFIVNRVARHYYVEALKLLEEGVANIETIDGLMENLGFKMGPFKLMDLIGVDTNLSVTKSVYELFHYDGKFRPSRIQQQKVDAGHHGRKTKQGFYKYE